MDRKTLGDYNILKQIGVGTLGSVYLAEHRFIKKQYVLKVLPEEMSRDRNFIQRFEKDIASLANLEHPHLVAVHNVSFADGYYFLVTDCIVDCFGETTNLAQYLSMNKQQFNENEVLAILSQVGTALSYLHQKKFNGVPLAHLNLKLNNVLIGKGEKGLHVVLSDFGLFPILGGGVILTRMYKVLTDLLAIPVEDSLFAKGGEEKYPIHLTDLGRLSKLHASFLQTYSFLPPEQRIYRSKPPSTSADIYAFGVLAYFLLFHCFPEGAFPLPSQAFPDFRLHWDLLITSCLSPDPAKRTSSAIDLLEKMLATYHSYGEKAPTSPREEESHLDWGDSVLQASSSSPSPPPVGGQMYFGGETKESSFSQTKQASTLVVEKKREENTFKEPLSSLPRAQREMLQEVSKLVESSTPQPVLKPQEIERPSYDPDPSAAFHIEQSVARYVPKEEKIENVEPLQTEMVVIRGGEFFRGSNKGVRDERPRHLVRINHFALDVHPVTNEQFARFLEVMGGEKDANNQDIIRLRDSRIKRRGGKLVIESGYGKHPVVGITWYGALAYAKWVGKRLPTEAEWEIASYGSVSDATYPTGEDIDRTQANFFSSDTTIVKSYPPNGYGLFDMAGNVYEWCQDWYDYTYYEASMQEPDQPQGPLQGVYRVLRGGCWKSLKEDMRCAHRHRNKPGVVNKTYGFRCAADVQEE